MTTGKSRHIAQAFQRVAVTYPARDRLAVSALGHQCLTLLDTADGYVGNEAGMRIALRDSRLILRQRDDAFAKRLGSTFRRRIAHAPTADKRFSYGRDFLHLGEFRRLERGKPFGGLLDFLIGHDLRDRVHAVDFEPDPALEIHHRAA